MLPEGHTEERLPRRRGRRPYFVERPIPREGPRPAPEPGDPAIAAAELLAAAGSLLSALRKPMREADLDLRLVRLLLTFPPNRAPLRIAQIAWRLGITTGAATRRSTVRMHASSLTGTTAAPTGAARGCS